MSALKAACWSALRASTCSWTPWSPRWPRSPSAGAVMPYLAKTASRWASTVVMSARSAVRWASVRLAVGSPWPPGPPLPSRGPCSGAVMPYLANTASRAARTGSMSALKAACWSALRASTCSRPSWSPPVGAVSPYLTNTASRWARTDAMSLRKVLHWSPVSDDAGPVHSVALVEGVGVVLAALAAVPPRSRAPVVATPAMVRTVLNREFIVVSLSVGGSPDVFGHISTIPTGAGAVCKVGWRLAGDCVQPTFRNRRACLQAGVGE